MRKKQEKQENPGHERAIAGAAPDSVNEAPRAPFDPGDPFDAMAEQFRTQLCDMIIKAQSITIYRELDDFKKLECFLAGTLAGVIGICFAHIEDGGRDEMIKYLGECLPVARRCAEEIIENGGPLTESGPTAGNKPS